MSINLPAPSINNPTVTINGQRIPHEDHLNSIAIGGFVFIGILLAVFIYYYVSSSFRERSKDYKSKESQARTVASSDTEAGADMDSTEKSLLLAWMHRRSRGRFVDITESVHQIPPIPYPPKLEPRSHGKRVNSFFSRISAVPNFVFPPLPPPVFSTQPPVRTCNASYTSSKTPIKRPFFAAYRLSFRSKSVLSYPEDVTTNTLPNCVSIVDSGYPVDNTTKPSCGTLDNSLRLSWIPRVPSPSRAVVIDKARNCGSTPAMMSEVKTESGTVQQQFPNSRARVVGESDPF